MKKEGQKHVKRGISEGRMITVAENVFISMGHSFFHVMIPRPSIKLDKITGADLHCFLPSHGT